MGNGPAGKKSSGLLMIDGVPYLWARNANRKSVRKGKTQPGRGRPAPTPRRNHIKEF